VIQASTYYTSPCDGCGASIKESHPTLAEQVEALKKENWEVVGRRCFCPRCVKAYRALSDAMTEAILEKADAPSQTSP
jgi:hypothetical protein